MAELEALSNKELRQKCVEFGLPNVPVTDSSRKILIKRLEAVMSKKQIATTPSKTKRRKTVHVSKLSKEPSSHKINVNNSTKKTTSNNRSSRRTVSVPERQVTTTVSDPEYSDVSSDRADEPVRAKTNTPEKPPPLYPKLPAKKLSSIPQQLSKTCVVTTSYMQETTPLRKTYETSGESYFVEGMEPLEKVTSYVSISEPNLATTAPFSSTRYQALAGYNYNKPKVLSSSEVRKTCESSSASYGKSAEPSQYTHAYKIENKGDYEDDEYDVPIEESSIKDVETPFLSQFARNLENLKATPIRHSVGPTKVTPPKLTLLRNRDIAYSRRTFASPLDINARRTINDYEDSSYRQFMLKMEKKYHLKQFLILTFIFILIVFIYVFFIQGS